ncbi:MAG: hypothetical protein RLZ53_813 [Actinomycetota bacterium]|jgi:hypothetical protein
MRFKNKWVLIAGVLTASIGLVGCTTPEPTALCKELEARSDHLVGSNPFWKVGEEAFYGFGKYVCNEDVQIVVKPIVAEVTKTDLVPYSIGKNYLVLGQNQMTMGSVWTMDDMLKDTTEGNNVLELGKNGVKISEGQIFQIFEEVTAETPSIFYGAEKFELQIEITSKSRSAKQTIVVRRDFGSDGDTTQPLPDNR